MILVRPSLVALGVVAAIAGPAHAQSAPPEPTPSAQAAATATPGPFDHVQLGVVHAQV